MKAVILFLLAIIVIDTGLDAYFDYKGEVVIRKDANIVGNAGNQ